MNGDEAVELRNRGKKQAGDDDDDIGYAKNELPKLGW